MADPTPILFTARDVIRAALEDINVQAEGETGKSPAYQQGLRHLNRLVSQLRLQEFTVPFISREVFAITALQSTYTIGPGGDFDTQRPQQIKGCGLVLAPALNNTTTEIPIAMINDDAYQLIRVKDLQNSQFIYMYYNPTYAAGLGTIFLWPTPTTDANSIALYLESYVPEFDDLDTQYSFPPGYFDLFEYGLARRLLIPYGIKASDVTGGIQQQFSQACALVKRQNVERQEQMTDTGVITGSGGVYDILSGTVH